MKCRLLFYLLPCVGSTLFATQLEKVLVAEKNPSQIEQEKISAPVAQLSEPTITKAVLKKSKQRMVRVLLEEHNAVEQTELTFTSKNGFIIESPFNSGITAAISKNELKVRTLQGRMSLECPDGVFRKIKLNELVIYNPYKRTQFNNKSYEGKICLKIDEKNNKLFVINNVELETYIYSVLRSESIPYWPLEMHKIQAIASRSYCYYLINAKRPRSGLYDLKNSNFNQLYNGHHQFKHLRQAVEETKGLILTYKGSPALTMFDVSCGGIIPGLMRHQDASKPYLSRTYQCNYCKRNMSCYIWKEDLHEKTFLSYLLSYAPLAKQLKDIGTLKDVKTLDKDKSGVVHKIQLIGSKKNITIPCKALKASIKGKIKSMALSIKKERDRVVITGRGHGHHQGLCQCGARDLIARGWDYKKILQFYFPHTRFARLT